MLLCSDNLSVSRTTISLSGKRVVERSVPMRSVGTRSYNNMHVCVHFVGIELACSLVIVDTESHSTTGKHSSTDSRHAINLNTLKSPKAPSSRIRYTGIGSS